MSLVPTQVQSGNIKENFITGSDKFSLFIENEKSELIDRIKKYKLRQISNI